MGEGVTGQVVDHYVATGVGSLQLVDDAVGELDAGRSLLAGAGDDVQNVHEKRDNGPGAGKNNVGSAEFSSRREAATGLAHKCTYISCTNIVYATIKNCYV